MAFKDNEVPSTSHSSTDDCDDNCNDGDDEIIYGEQTYIKM